jgi:hypothetical protein
MAISLEDLSPLAGIASGKGMIGNLAAKGGIGLLPQMIAKDAQEDAAAKILAESKASALAEEERARKANMLAQSGSTIQMKKGGMTSSASKRGDGCAQRGKTRGKMV